MIIDQKLIISAVALAEKNYAPGTLAGAAAMYTDKGTILTSTFPCSDTVYSRLCYETGAICEAHKLQQRITATVCVVRRTGKDKYIFYAPCGVCQERLFFWGGDIEVAIPDPKDPCNFITKTLSEIQPYWWAEVLNRS